jgi:hypothetical protein
LRLLHARVPEHQLDDPNVDAIRQEPAGISHRTTGAQGIAERFDMCVCTVV